MSQYHSLLQSAAVSPRMVKHGFSLSKLELILLPLLLSFGSLMIGTGVDTALFNTLLLFLLVTLTGLWLSHRTWRLISDKNLRILGAFWLIKLAVTLTLLFAGWIPQLDPGSASWGYDPQRYYQDSWDLVLNAWSPTTNLNYQGILYYYASVFYIFGHNPVIPALLNTFVTLCGSLFLIRCLYDFAPIRTSKDWRIAYILMIPEVLWFDIMTSRETLMAILIIVAVLVAGRYLIGENRVKLINALTLFFIASVGILTIRTSMMMPVMVSITVMALLLKSRRGMGPMFKLVTVGMGISALSAGPLIQRVTGGYDVDYLKALDQIQSFENNVAAEMDWGESSIGLLLAPNNLWQTVAFLPPRMVLYLAAPLPKMDVSINNLLAGSWEAWQLLMTLPTSVFMLLGFPYVLAGTAQAWHNRRKFPSAFIIPIAFWISFAAIAGGNIIIHERYRLMVTLLLFACMWLGHTQCRPALVMRWAFTWFVMLGSGAIFYIIYKIN